MHNTATDRRLARLHSKTPTTPLTTLSSNLRRESAAEHHTTEKYSKTGRTKLQKDFRRGYRSWNTYQDFLMIQRLRAATLKTDRRCLIKVILASSVTPNMRRSADSFSTVPSRVNGINWGWTVRALETIIVLVFLAFSFISHRSHHTTLFKSTH